MTEPVSDLEKLKNVVTLALDKIDDKIGMPEDFGLHEIALIAGSAVEILSSVATSDDKLEDKLGKAMELSPLILDVLEDTGKITKEKRQSLQEQIDDGFGMFQTAVNLLVAVSGQPDLLQAGKFAVQKIRECTAECFPCCGRRERNEVERRKRALSRQHRRELSHVARKRARTIRKATA